MAHRWAICHWHAPQEALFVLEGSHPFNHDSFVAMLCHCLKACGIAPSSYSGHSFQRGTDSNTIWALGQWCSDCFHHYVDKSANIHAATSRMALYANTSASLRLDTLAWHNF